MTVVASRGAGLLPDPAWAPQWFTSMRGGESDGDSVADFAEALLVASKGMRAGEPLSMAAWQRWLLRWLLERRDGRFRYRQAVVGVPRKTGKSMIGSALALHYLAGLPDLGREIYSVAGDRQQAKIVFGEARWQVLNNPYLSKELKVFRDAIEHPVTGSVYRVLSHDGKLAQGLNPFLSIADEALALDTQVPTPGGWTTVGEIAVGDKVFGADGRVVMVTALTPVKVGRPCFRVTFTDGTSVVADADHKWLAGWHGGSHLKVRSTAELVPGASRLPRNGAIDTPEADLPIDPYLLGLWLGDGSKGQSYVHGALGDIEFYAAELSQRGVPARCYPLANRPGMGRLSLSVSRDDMCRRGHSDPDWYYKTRPNGVVQRECRRCTSARHAGDGLPDRVVVPFGEVARSLGVYEEKSIPAAYLRASREQRLALLQGLMDTDGHIAKSGSAVFVQQRAVLVEGFAELARSLGYRVSVTWRDDSRASTGRIAKISIGSSGPCPVRLPRKAARWADRARSTVGVVSVEPVDSVPVRCLTVDAEDHLFLVGDGFTVTHNCHVYPNEELYQALLQGSGARAESLLVSITTAGDYRDDALLTRLFDYGRACAAGENDDPSFGFAWWQAPDGCDHRDEGLWRRANPNLDLGLADLEEMRSAVKSTPEVAFRRYRLNQMVALGGSRWMDMAAWKRAARPDVEVVRGTPIVMAFDGSVTDDATALVGMTLDGHVFVLGVWESDGSDDWSVPRGEVMGAVEDAFELFDVRVFQADTAYWLVEFQQWQERFGKRRVLDFTMSNARMVPAVQEFFAGVGEGVITHPGDARLDRHVSNAVVHETPRGVSIRKQSRGSAHKIDLAVAACMANDARLRVPRAKSRAMGF